MDSNQLNKFKAAVLEKFNEEVKLNPITSNSVSGKESISTITISFPKNTDEFDGIPVHELFVDVYVNEIFASVSSTLSSIKVSDKLNYDHLLDICNAGYKKMIVNSQLASIISDRSDFKLSEITKELNFIRPPKSLYKLGTLGRSEIWVNPYVNWNDLKLQEYDAPFCSLELIENDEDPYFESQNSANYLSPFKIKTTTDTFTLTTYQVTNTPSL